MNEEHDSVDEVAVQRAHKHWSKDSRTLGISSGPVKEAAVRILVGLSIDPDTLRPLVKSPLVATCKIEESLLAANRLDAEQFVERVRSSLYRILKRDPAQLEFKIDADGFVVLTYTP